MWLTGGGSWREARSAKRKSEMLISSLHTVSKARQIRVLGGTKQRRRLLFEVIKIIKSCIDEGTDEERGH